MSRTLFPGYAADVNTGAVTAVELAEYRIEGEVIAVDRVTRTITIRLGPDVDDAEGPICGAAVVVRHTDFADSADFMAWRDPLPQGAPR
jgi:hypothetical protein